MVNNSSFLLQTAQTSHQDQQDSTFASNAIQIANIERSVIPIVKRLDNF
jgi:hypothetical protein